MVADQADCSLASKLESESLRSVHSNAMCAARSSGSALVDGFRLVKTFSENVRHTAFSSRAGSLPSLSMRCLSSLTSSAYRSR